MFNSRCVSKNRKYYTSNSSIEKVYYFNKYLYEHKLKHFRSKMYCFLLCTKLEWPSLSLYSPSFSLRADNVIQMCGPMSLGHKLLEQTLWLCFRFYVDKYSFLHKYTHYTVILWRCSKLGINYTPETRKSHFRRTNKQHCP